MPIELEGADGEVFGFRVGGIRVSISMDAPRESRRADEMPEWMTSWQPTSTARLRLEDVQVDAGAGSARATVRVVAWEESLWHIDAHAPLLSAADAIAAAGAITEAAVFHRAGVQRDAVGNFWMRRAHIDFDAASVRRSSALLSVETVHSHVFERGASRWHSARVRVESGFGFRIRADVAFEEHPRQQAGGDSPVGGSGVST
ncbi:AvrD family protein [Leifsonia sp. Leaf336]|uniref:AvrD family protein n=1 Tax=Leifsonia sp. Leaf336 TaxID=1736341 RepID=UPI001F279E5D|nr:AvrD family protein [Leifsonia sp. Leaf336]